jgi:excisionase family DNA binding protein
LDAIDAAIAPREAMSAAETGLLQAIAKDVAKLVMDELRAELRKPASVQKLLYDIDEAAIILGRSKRSVEQLIHERELAVVRVGRRTQVHKRDLDEFIERNRE